MATDGVDIIYALRGDDSGEIYRYVISNDAEGWIKGPDIIKTSVDKMGEGATLGYLAGDVYATQGDGKRVVLRISPLPPFPGP